MRSIFFLCSFFFILSPAVYELFGQSGGPNPDRYNLNVNGPSELQDQQKIRDSLVFWQESILLNTDKSIFSPEEILFFRADILVGPEQIRLSASEVLKVELLNEMGEILASQFHRLERGMSSGSLQIPKKIKKGSYFLRAYTRWMLNYSPELIATKEVLIKDDRNSPNSKSNEIELRPESGYLVDQLTTQVMVFRKDGDMDQLPIVDSNGSIVTRISEFGNGIGRFLLTPLLGEEYYIRTEGEELIKLPEVQESGYVISLNNISSEKALVRIDASTQVLDMPVFFKGIQNGLTFFESEIAFEGNDWEQIEIPKTGIPSGILELRIEDISGQVWASRPMRIKGQELQIDVHRHKDPQGNEEIEIKVVDDTGTPVETELSVSLVEDLNASSQARSSQREQGGMALRGQRFIDDLLVLTGQLDNEQNTSVREIPEEIRYSFQKGLEFYGQAYDLNNTLLENKEIQMLITTEEEVFALETKTNSNGMFKITGMQIKGEANIVFRTAGEETGEKLVKVVPYEYEIPPLTSAKNFASESEKREKLDPDLPQRYAGEFDLDIDPEKLIALDEVTLVATRELHKTSQSRYNLQATRVISQDKEKPKPIPQLFLNIPGVQVVGLGDLNPTIFIPRAARLGPILWVLDGFPLDQSTKLRDIISLVNYTDIERIELFIGAEASFYGSRAAGGVILIYTRSGSDIEYLVRKDAEVQYEGYHESVSFEEYSNNRKKSRMPVGIPTTLYWEPKLKTDKNGKAVIRLTSSVENTPVNVEVKAITENGLKGRAVTYF